MKKLFLFLMFLAVPALAAEHDHHDHNHGHDNNAHGHNHGAATQATSVASAKAMIKGVDAAARTIKVTHEPIAAFNWPAMTMDLPLADSALVQGIKPGAQVILRIEKRSPVDYVVVGISAQKATNAQ